MKPRIMMISMKSNLRTMRHIGLLLMFIFCLTAQNMMAQRGKLFNSDNQLSSNLATQVFQDSNGFIWIATRNGLNIYDHQKNQGRRQRTEQQLHQLYYPRYPGAYSVGYKQLSPFI